MAGEHSVLRGVPALVFPLASRALSLNYETDSSDLKLTLSGEYGKELEILFWGVLEKACEKQSFPRAQIRGRVHIESGIPVGAGLGASAALCVAMSRWFSSLGMIQESEIGEFSRQLENLFHGESSGVDIAIAMRGCPLIFRRNENPVELPLKWSPILYVSYSGQRGMTSECVNQVKRLFETNPDKALKLDQQMSAAVAKCEKALRDSSPAGFHDLASALSLAGDCFAQWGLVEGAPANHMKRLTDAGALAVKPTGSGRGGFVLSLWSQEPPANLRGELIPCFKS